VPIMVLKGTAGAACAPSRLAPQSTGFAERVPSGGRVRSRFANRVLSTLAMSGSQSDTY
jgi:hypothetical protein